MRTLAPLSVLVFALTSATLGQPTGDKPAPQAPTVASMDRKELEGYAKLLEGSNSDLRTQLAALRKELSAKTAELVSVKAELAKGKAEAAAAEKVAKPAPAPKEQEQPAAKVPLYEEPLPEDPIKLKVRVTQLERLRTEYLDFRKSAIEMMNANANASPTDSVGRVSYKVAKENVERANDCIKKCEAAIDAATEKILRAEAKK